MSQYPSSEMLHPVTIYERLPNSTCLRRHVYSAPWARFHLLLRIEYVLFLSGSSSQLTLKPRNLRKILWDIQQKNNSGDIHNVSSYNRSLRICWLCTTGKPLCCADYIISPFKLSQSLEKILSGNLCGALLCLYSMV